MKLLLDTHIWLWSLLAPRQLSPRIRKALSDRANELWLSPISVWELGILVDRNRVTLDTELSRWVAESFRIAGLREAPITSEVALQTASIELPHRDPADRFLAATARVYELTLATADSRLIQSRLIPTIPSH